MVSHGVARTKINLRAAIRTYNRGVPGSEDVFCTFLHMQSGILESGFLQSGILQSRAMDFVVEDILSCLFRNVMEDPSR